MSENDTKYTMWVKPNGTEIKLNNNPATIEQAEEYGWKKVEVKKEVKK